MSASAYRFANIKVEVGSGGSFNWESNWALSFRPDTSHVTYFKNMPVPSLTRYYRFLEKKKHQTSGRQRKLASNTSVLYRQKLVLYTPLAASQWRRIAPTTLKVKIRTCCHWQNAQRPANNMDAVSRHMYTRSLVYPLSGINVGTGGGCVLMLHKRNTSVICVEATMYKT